MKIEVYHKEDGTMIASDFDRIVITTNSGDLEIDWKGKIQFDTYTADGVKGVATYQYDRINNIIKEIE